MAFLLITTIGIVLYFFIETGAKEEYYNNCRKTRLENNTKHAWENTIFAFFSYLIGIFTMITGLFMGIIPDGVPILGFILFFMGLFLFRGIALHRKFIKDFYNEFEEMQKNEEIQIQKAMDKITSFVKMNIDENIQFPKLMLINNENYVKALHQILKNENIEINIENLKSLINKEFETQIISIFRHSFLKLNPDLKNSKNINEWLNAYVNIFENNFNYVPEFVKMLDLEDIPVIFDDNFKEHLKLCKKIKTWDKETLDKILSAEKEKSYEDIKDIYYDSIDYNNSEQVENIYISILLTNIIDERSVSELAKNISSAFANGEKLVTTTKTTIEDIDRMEGLEFENFLYLLFSEKGYKAEITKASGDQGADLIIEKFGEKTVVQAKRYSYDVSNSAIQEVVAAKAYYNCNNAMVITNSFFTKSAVELAQANNVELCDRKNLEIMINELNSKTVVS